MRMKNRRDGIFVVYIYSNESNFPYLYSVRTSNLGLQRALLGTGFQCTLAFYQYSRCVLLHKISLSSLSGLVSPALPEDNGMYHRKRLPRSE